MLFKKSYSEIVQQSLNNLLANTDITNTSIGGITRSLIEIISKTISEYYDVLDVNMAMSFLSTSEGYYLDLIGSLFNMPRQPAVAANASVTDGVQRFYVLTGVLLDKIPSGQIPVNTGISTQDGQITYYVSSDVSFSASATSVYVPIFTKVAGERYNVAKNSLINHSLNIAGVYTTNDKAIQSGQDTESDANYKYRLMNATLSAEKANEIAIRLACLSTPGVSDCIIRPYARGIGTFDVIVIPTEGIANSTLITAVQTAIDDVKAVGITGTAIAPTIVPVDIEVKLIFVTGTTDYEKETIRSSVKSSIEKYTVNIPIGGTFVLNELRQQIMDVSPKIKDHVISCYYFREEPTFLGNVDIYWDEMFYPNPSSPEAIRVL
jgi:uncharacterized phage protein gp47/JayE